MPSEQVLRDFERLSYEDAYAEGLAHGYEVATLRAESRRRLGLPLDRPATDDELRQLTHNYRCTLDQHALAPARGQSAFGGMASQDWRQGPLVRED